LTPDQLAELQAAWADLAGAAQDSGVKHLQACTRKGKTWHQDLAAVRNLAATLRSLSEEGTTPSP
jgi:hypothetical protein